MAQPQAGPIDQRDMKSAHPDVRKALTYLLNEVGARWTWSGGKSAVRIAGDDGSTFTQSLQTAEGTTRVARWAAKALKQSIAEHDLREERDRLARLDAARTEGRALPTEPRPTTPSSPTPAVMPQARAQEESRLVSELAGQPEGDTETDDRPGDAYIDTNQQEIPYLRWLRLDGRLVIYCTECDSYLPTRRNVPGHVRTKHTAGVTDLHGDEARAKANETKAERGRMAVVTLDKIAEAIRQFEGDTTIDQLQARVERLQAQVNRLQRDNERLTEQRDKARKDKDDAEAKLALVKEAMRA